MTLGMVAQAFYSTLEKQRQVDLWSLNPACSTVSYRQAQATLLPVVVNHSDSVFSHFKRNASFWKSGQ